MAGPLTEAPPPAKGRGAKHFLDDNNTEGTLCHALHSPFSI